MLNCPGGDHTPKLAKHAIIIILLIMIVSVYVALYFVISANASVAQFVNPGFEDSLAGWDNPGGWLCGTDFHTGTKSAYDNLGGGYRNLSQRVDLTNTGNITFWEKNTHAVAGSTDKIRIWIDNTTLLHEWVAGTGGVWTLFSHDLAYFGSHYITISGTVLQNVITVDDFSLGQGGQQYITLDLALVDYATIEFLVNANATVTDLGTAEHQHVNLPTGVVQLLLKENSDYAIEGNKSGYANCTEYFTIRTNQTLIVALEYNKSMVPIPTMVPLPTTEPMPTMMPGNASYPSESWNPVDYFWWIVDALKSLMDWIILIPGWLVAQITIYFNWIVENIIIFLTAALNAINTIIQSILGFALDLPGQLLDVITYPIIAIINLLLYLLTRIITPIVAILGVFLLMYISFYNLLVNLTGALGENSWALIILIGVGIVIGIRLYDILADIELWGFKLPKLGGK